MKQTKNSMILLLIVGAILAGIVLWLLSLTVFGTYILYSFSSLLIFIAIACYPLAIVYGRPDIKRVYESIRIGSYRLFRMKKTYANLLNAIIAIVITVLFGWVYGTYGAYRNLKYKKPPLRRVK
ncbi:hypothetical protein P9B03_20435 [Metasolibacillus meyeri]|uniref:Uncharacterized protein n=1 Tax=Metasolibacillus meyeri TaxID=1071052 RepID=A0AAW9NW53_9BACL|nr:hypothetical protein [Metasolibacillus meyeri]MEC1180822.1 hypothetical protein [Metasolibacillus meyeri]